MGDYTKIQEANGRKARKGLKIEKANFERRVCMTKPRVPKKKNKKINA